MVDGVVRIGGNDVARVGGRGRVWAGYTAKIDVLKVGLRRIGPGHHIALVIAVRNADARETVLDRIARRDRYALGILRIVQQVLRTQVVIQADQVGAR